VQASGECSNYVGSAFLRGGPRHQPVHHAAFFASKSRARKPSRYASLAWRNGPPCSRRDRQRWHTRSAAGCLQCAEVRTDDRRCKGTRLCLASQAALPSASPHGAPDLHGPFHLCGHVQDWSVEAPVVMLVMCMGAVLALSLVLASVLLSKLPRRPLRAPHSHGSVPFLWSFAGLGRRGARGGAHDVPGRRARTLACACMRHSSLHPPSHACRTHPQMHALMLRSRLLAGTLRCSCASLAGASCCANALCRRRPKASTASTQANQAAYRRSYIGYGRFAHVRPSYRPACSWPCNSSFELGRLEPSER
jgi:hypothetical protein